jgi:hypothetical protein
MKADDRRASAFICGSKTKRHPYRIAARMAFHFSAAGRPSPAAASAAAAPAASPIGTELPVTR